MPEHETPALPFNNCMNMESSFQKLERILVTYTASIRYQPLPDEVDYTVCGLLAPVLGDSMIVPDTNNADPLAWATICASRYRHIVPCILVPGSRFDIQGTRYGRGMGWYDRFLATVPTNWLRIGIMDIAQLSPATLVRQARDEPVDWIIAQDGSSWRVYQTHARHL